MRRGARRGLRIKAWIWAYVRNLSGEFSAGWWWGGEDLEKRRGPGREGGVDPGISVVKCVCKMLRTRDVLGAIYYLAITS